MKKPLSMIQIRNRISMLCKDCHVADVVGGCLSIVRQAMGGVPEKAALLATAATMRQLALEMEERANAQ
jgi:hypothetical protein